MRQNVRGTEEADRDAARLLDVLDKVDSMNDFYVFKCSQWT